MSDSLRPHGLQHTRLPCPSPSPRVCSNSCPLSRWCHPIISSSVIRFSSYLQSFPAEVFSNELALWIKWPEYWSFSISPSKEYSGLISFRIDWLDFQGLLADSSSPSSIRIAFINICTGKPKNLCTLLLVWYLLYCGSLEQNPQYQDITVVYSDHRQQYQE